MVMKGMRVDQGRGTLGEPLRAYGGVLDRSLSSFVGSAVEIWGSA